MILCSNKILVFPNGASGKEFCKLVPGCHFKFEENEKVCLLKRPAWLLKGGSDPRMLYQMLTGTGSWTLHKELFDDGCMNFKASAIWNDKENLMIKFIELNGIDVAIWCAWHIVKGMISKVQE